MSEILERTQFLPLQDRLVVRAKFKVKLSSGVKFAYFMITMPLYSALLSSKSKAEIQRDAEETFVQSVNEKRDIEGVYYFEHTGSHFHQLDEKPDWADDHVQMFQEVCECTHSRELHSRLFGSFEDGEGPKPGVKDAQCHADDCSCQKYMELGSDPTK